MKNTAGERETERLKGAAKRGQAVQNKQHVTRAMGMCLTCTARGNEDVQVPLLFVFVDGHVYVDRKYVDDVRKITSRTSSYLSSWSCVVVI